MQNATINTSRPRLEGAEASPVNSATATPTMAITLPLLARSGFILRSPRRVSRKREFSWIRLETFGNSRPKKFEHRSPETNGDEKSPRLAGLSHRGKKILQKLDCLAGDAVLIAPVSMLIPC